MTWVKVCGLRRPEDVAAAVAAGADAAGFVIASASPRSVTVDEARRLAAGVPIQRVLVTVDLTPDALLAAADAAAIDGVQPHGEHSAAACEAALAAGLFVLRPVPVRPGQVLPAVPPGGIPLFDTHRPDRHGGTGEAFEWERLSDRRAPFVVAGGLGPHNVAAAIEATGAWGVDASSGLEAEVGIKDEGKVLAFVQEARRA
jgi:phosphoribosylanthranilate isomerase